MVQSESGRRPVRKCVACRRRAPKDGLLRMVREDGRLVWDEKQIKPGRGYYLCPEEKCIGLLADHKRVSRVFGLAAGNGLNAGLISLIIKKTQGASDGQNAGL